MKGVNFKIETEISSCQFLPSTELSTISWWSERKVFLKTCKNLKTIFKKIQGGQERCQARAHFYKDWIYKTYECEREHAEADGEREE